MRLSIAAGLAVISGVAWADSIVVQSTTSTANSGLYDYLLPQFALDHEVTVNVVAVGTGQAIKNASNCDGDVLLVHAKDAEELFVAEGRGVTREDLMYNDFVLVGPKSDPAGVQGSEGIIQALATIANKKVRFASRGDDSGTHKKEMQLWEKAQQDPISASGTWYLETGSGMGATLNTGIGLDAYVLTDRATWATFGNKQQHTIVVEDDDELFNQYGVILVNPEVCPNVNIHGGTQFIDWLLSAEGQSSIGAFNVDGQQLFFPNARSQ